MPWPRKSVDEVKIVDFGVRADNSVLIKAVIIIMAGPCMAQLDCFEDGNTFCKCGPDNFFKQIIIRIEIIRLGRAVLIFNWRHTRDKACALRAHPNASRIDDQRHVLDNVLAGEREHSALARLNRQFYARKTGDLAGSRSSCVYKGLSRQFFDYFAL